MIANLNKAETSLLDWSGREEKRHADSIVFQQLNAWFAKQTKRHILSFPAEAWWWERALLNKFPKYHKTLVGLESNWKVWCQMRKFAEENHVRQPHVLKPCDSYMTFRQYAQSFVPGESKPFDMIYLDWMGTWGMEKYWDIQALFEQQMFKNGTGHEYSVLRFTTAMTRGWPGKWQTSPGDCDRAFEYADIRGGGGPIEDWRVYGVPSTVIGIAKANGYKAKLMSVQVYYTQREGLSRQPEGSFLLKIK